MYDQDMTPWSSQAFGDPQALEEARSYRNRLRDKQRESARQAIYKRTGGANFAAYPQAPNASLYADQQRREMQALESQWGDEDGTEADDYNFTRNQVGRANAMGQANQRQAQMQQLQTTSDANYQNQMAQRNAAAQKYYQNWMRQMQAAGVY